ncbi:MAG: DivIVA domain-containing protein [Actinomycetaceae bacterium]|nr:DivIVA domain-containing protein [Actinomycetaceae bacterium]
MALLTAEDVHYKTFTPTKFREGYDQDEVDLFLDQVVATITALQEGAAPADGEADAALREENARLKADLEEARRAASMASGDSGEQVVRLQEELSRVRAEGEGLRGQLQQSNEELRQAHSQLQNLNAELEQTKAQAVQEQSLVDESESATSMLEMARRLHDEFVEEGKAKSEEIVAEAHTKSEHIISEARAEKDRVTEQLNSERSMLEHKIEELKVFENEYRKQIKSHLVKLINTVENKVD